MSLSDTALITLNQAKQFLKIEPSATVHVDAEYIGAGDGAETHFALDNTPLEGTLKLYLNNSLLTENTHYTISGANITFVVYPPVGQAITASYDYAAVADSFESYEDELLEHLINAATKKVEDYTGKAFINRTVTDTLSGGGDYLRLTRRPVVSIASVSYKKVGDYEGDGSTAAFALGDTPMSGTYHVYVAGVEKEETTDYMISGETLTFEAPPADGALIIVRYEVELVLNTDYTELLSQARLKGDFDEDLEYVVVYTAGSGATRAVAQSASPDAVMAVKSAVAVWYENRLGIKSQSISGVGSEDYGEPDDLPPVSKKYLSNVRVNLI